MQRNKYVNNSNRSQDMEVKDTINVEKAVDERINNTVGNSCKQRTILRVGRQ